MKKNNFTHKLARILVIQALGSQREIEPTDPYSNWHTVGGIMGSGEYQNHLEQMWADSDKKLSAGKLVKEKEDL